MQSVDTDVVIVGGGPAGLMLAIELGCRGVACILIEEDRDEPAFPKANATSARTMEHYRRRGFANEVRSLGLTADHPQDVVYCTRLAGTELARFRIPSRQEAAGQRAFGDYGEAAWPTPELPHRGQQMFIEPVLRRQLALHPSVDARYGWHATAVYTHADQAEVEVTPPDGAALQTLRCRYVVGCDGPRSLVRKSMGVGYSGTSQEARDFFGGQMLSVHFRSPDLYDVLGKERAWQYWAVNAEQRCLLVAIDGIDTFMLCIQLLPGQSAETVDHRRAAQLAVGAPFTMNVIATAPWLAGYMLVADRFQSGRALIAGDAAHLFTPSGGMGYNTSVDDAVNLGWKLAAVVQGWAPEALLRSYEAERQPIAQRNTRFARAMADSIGRVSVPPSLEHASSQGETDRRALGEALAAHVRQEFNIPGLQLGLSYRGSPIVATEPGPAEPDEPNRYQPSGSPGGRAPHVWLGEQSLLDRFGRDFTLLCFDGRDTSAWRGAAEELGMPLAVVHIEHPEARALYGADCVLIRPDHHVAWRGSAIDEVLRVLRHAVGHTLGAEHQVSVTTAQA